MQRKEFNPADIDCVVNAANYLEVSEFVISRDSYTAWYGKSAPEKRLKGFLWNTWWKARFPSGFGTTPGVVLQKVFSQEQSREYSRTANYLLYLATIIAEYVLLASYLVMR
jgi:hypothetical protein